MAGSTPCGQGVYCSFVPSVTAAVREVIVWAETVAVIEMIIVPAASRFNVVGFLFMTLPPWWLGR